VAREKITEKVTFHPKPMSNQGAIHVYFKGKEFQTEGRENEDVLKWKGVGVSKKSQVAKVAEVGSEN
jgi:hypothetical protein